MPSPQKNIWCDIAINASNIDIELEFCIHGSPEDYEFSTTHIWLVSISGDNAANTVKVQGYALCLPTKRMGLPRTSPIMLLPRHEIAEARRLPPPPHLTPTHVAHLSHSPTPKRTKKPPCAQQESQCARRLKERIARKGGLGRMGYYFLYDWSNSGKIIFGSFLNSFNEISSFSIFFMTSGKSFKANFSSFFIATRIPLTSSQYAFA